MTLHALSLFCTALAVWFIYVAAIVVLHRLG